MSEEVKQEGEFKVKKKPGRPRKLVEKDNSIKVDLDKKEEKDAVQEPESKESVLQTNEESKDEGKETKVELQDVGETHTEKQEATEESKEIEESVIEEVASETPKPEVKAETPKQPYVPENLESLVKFMNETGGTVEDYVNLNKDYTKLDDNSILREFYKKSKPHLNAEEIEFLLEDKYSWDEEVEDARSIKKKKLLYKEEVANARNYMEKSKKEYYKNITPSSSLTEDQKAALDFVKTYQETRNRQEELHGHFKQKTVDFFQNKFEGFKFDVGEKSFRYKLNNPESTAGQQSNITSVFEKFLNKEGEVIDYAGYHKAIYAARNADNLVKHFYEQGKADATKDIMAKSKNIQTDTRTASPNDMFINGLKVKAVTGMDSSKLKIKKRT